MRRAMLVLVLPLLLHAQDTRCSVDGMVVNSATGEPVRRAAVSLRRTEPGQSKTSPGTYTVPADAQGKFLFADIEPGAYNLVAERSGFAQPKRNNSIKLEPGQKSTGQLVLMTPHAVITGRVLDPEGDPVTGADVQAQAVTWSGGRRLSRVAGASTNDLGEYRIFGLPAGKYYLSATFNGGQHEVGQEFGVTYYPRTTDDAAAAPVQVAAGAQLRNMDITLTRIRTGTIRGHVACEIPGEKRMYSMTLMGSSISLMRPARVQQDGSFEITRVPPGPYNLMATATIDEKRYTAHLQVQVAGGDLNGIVIPIHAGGTVAGRIFVEDHPDEALGGITVGLRGWQTNGIIFGPQPNAKTEKDGSFQLENVPFDHFAFYAAGLPSGYYLKRVHAGGIDVLTSGLETGSGFGTLMVVVSSKAATIEGTVKDARSEQPYPSATVVLVPENRARTELFQQASSDRGGRFTFRTVVPGEYRVFAWEDVPAFAWMDPDFLREFESQGERVSVAEGARPSLDLKLIPAR
jgi:protocatechuate 3,4-dioxygenase beta subunit